MNQVATVIGHHIPTLHISGIGGLAPCPPYFLRHWSEPLFVISISGTVRRKLVALPGGHSITQNLVV